MRNNQGKWERVVAAGLGALACLCLAGCASVSVASERVNPGAAPREVPPEIWVRDFGYKLTRNQTAQYGPELPAFLDARAAQLTAESVKSLRKGGFKTSGVRRASPLPSRGWLVAGNITWMQVGNRWLRTGLGFGEGATRMDTEVYVFDLSQRGPDGSLPPAFYGFRTTGGSGIAPGVVPGVALSGTVTPITLVGTTLKAQADLDDDIKRSGRMISGALQDYLVQQGLIPPERQQQHPKRLGEWGTEQYLR